MDLTNISIVGIIAIFIATIIAPRMPETVGLLLNNNIIVFMLLLGIFYVGKQDLVVGLVCSVAFFLLYQNIIETKISNIIMSKTHTLIESQPIIINDVKKE